MSSEKLRILAYIPARSGSKRIPNKNIKNFCGKPLIAHTILRALKNSSIDRVIVDTDSAKIARIGKKYGAWVPFLRPQYLAKDTSQLIDSVLYVLDKLRRESNYRPDYVMLLQATSPLCDQKDINGCIDLAMKENSESVATVCETEPLFFTMKKNLTLSLANMSKFRSTNSQQLPKGYMLNGNVFLIKTEVLLKEKKFFTDNARSVITPKLRSIDIDTPEDWVMAELLYKNSLKIKKRISTINS